MKESSAPAAADIPAYPSDITAAIRAGGFSDRFYQRYAVYQALEVLVAGKNAEVVLPPGTGKTLIAQIVAVLWARRSAAADQRVLFLLPTRLLREQHFYVCLNWAEALCGPLEVSSEWLRNRAAWHANLIEKHNFYFALPVSLEGGLQSGKFSATSWAQVGLVICDEYDAFSVGILRAEGMGERDSKSFDALRESLAQRKRAFLLMSATPLPSGSGS